MIGKKRGKKKEEKKKKSRRNIPQEQGRKWRGGGEGERSVFLIAKVHSKGKRRSGEAPPGRALLLCQVGKVRLPLEKYFPGR